VSQPREPTDPPLPLSLIMKHLTKSAAVILSALMILFPGFPVSGRPPLPWPGASNTPMVPGVQRGIQVMVWSIQAVVARHKSSVMILKSAKSLLDLRFKYFPAFYVATLL